ncbi:MAG: hypothetical protein FJ104_03990 [Deltaproteobacteria bacterium]|nr:hypothetical protein [Deltaproteobacteria bacterium]
MSLEDSGCDVVSALSHVDVPRQPRPESAIRQYFAPHTLERVGWEYAVFPGVRMCGGVVPDALCMTSPERRSEICAADLRGERRECPPPPCAVCPFGRACSRDSECASGLRDQRPGGWGKCEAPWTCNDGVLSGPESDVDCGGEGVCPACADGQGCNVADDCQSGICACGRCATQ